MLPHATRKDPRLQHSNEQLGHAIAIMPARIEKNKNFMNVTNRVLQCCAVVKNYGRKNAKLAWTTPFVPDTNGTVVAEVISSTVFTQFFLEDVSRLLHKRIAVAAAFDYARLKTAGAVADSALGDAFQKLIANCS